MATEVQTVPSSVSHKLPVYHQPEESKTERQYATRLATHAQADTKASGLGRPRHSRPLSVRRTRRKRETCRTARPRREQSRLLVIPRPHIISINRQLTRSQLHHQLRPLPDANRPAIRHWQEPLQPLHLRETKLPRRPREWQLLRLPPFRPLRSLPRFTRQRRNVQRLQIHP
jgi:hypothetical protein